MRSSDVARKAAAAAKLAGRAAGPKDPLADFRHLLAAGKVMKLWAKGVPKPQHFQVSNDWRSFVWQEPGTSRKLGAVNVGQLQVVRPGTGDGHRKALLTREPVNPACAFVVVGSAASIDIEAGNPRERDLWVDVSSRGGGGGGWGGGSVMHCLASRARRPH
jgi:hypothetical protein